MIRRSAVMYPCTTKMPCFDFSHFHPRLTTFKGHILSSLPTVQHMSAHRKVSLFDLISNLKLPIKLCVATSLKGTQEGNTFMKSLPQYEGFAIVHSGQVKSLHNDEQGNKRLKRKLPQSESDKIKCKRACLQIIRQKRKGNERPRHCCKRNDATFPVFIKACIPIACKDNHPQKHVTDHFDHFLMECNRRNKQISHELNRLRSGLDSIENALTNRSDCDKKDLLHHLQVIHDKREDIGCDLYWQSTLLRQEEEIQSKRGGREGHGEGNVRLTVPKECTQDVDEEQTVTVSFGDKEYKIKNYGTKNMVVIEPKIESQNKVTCPSSDDPNGLDHLLLHQTKKTDRKEANMADFTIARQEKCKPLNSKETRTENVFREKSSELKLRSCLSDDSASCLECDALPLTSGDQDLYREEHERFGINLRYPMAAVPFGDPDESIRSEVKPLKEKNYEIVNQILSEETSVKRLVYRTDDFGRDISVKNSQRMEETELQQKYKDCSMKQITTSMTHCPLFFVSEPEKIDSLVSQTGPTYSNQQPNMDEKGTDLVKLQMSGGGGQLLSEHQMSHDDKARHPKRNEFGTQTSTTMGHKIMCTRLGGPLRQTAIVEEGNIKPDVPVEMNPRDHVTCSFIDENRDSLKSHRSQDLLDNCKQQQACISNNYNFEEKQALELDKIKPIQKPMVIAQQDNQEVGGNQRLNTSSFLTYLKGMIGLTPKETKTPISPAPVVSGSQFSSTNGSKITTQCHQLQHAQRISGKMSSRSNSVIENKCAKEIGVRKKTKYFPEARGIDAGGIERGDQELMPACFSTASSLDDSSLKTMDNNHMEDNRRKQASGLGNKPTNMMSRLFTRITQTQDPRYFKPFYRILFGISEIEEPAVDIFMERLNYDFRHETTAEQNYQLLLAWQRLIPRTCSIELIVKSLLEAKDTDSYYLVCSFLGIEVKVDNRKNCRPDNTLEERRNRKVY